MLNLLYTYDTDTMKLKDNYNFVTFAGFPRIAPLKQAFSRVIQGGAKQATTGVEAAIDLPSTLKTIKEANQHSKLGNKLNLLGLATLPIGLTPLVVKDASTKSAEQMRAEDKAREAKGLPPLANNAQAKALAATDNAAGAAGSVSGATDVANAPVPSTLSRKTKDGIVRVTNLTDPRFIN